MKINDDDDDDEIQPNCLAECTLNGGGEWPVVVGTVISSITCIVVPDNGVRYQVLSCLRAYCPTIDGQTDRQTDRNTRTYTDPHYVRRFSVASLGRKQCVSTGVKLTHPRPRTGCYDRHQ